MITKTYKKILFKSVQNLWIEILFIQLVIRNFIMSITHFLIKAPA